MNGWFCRSAFGPFPSRPMGVTRTNGSPAQTITAKKNAAPSASVAPTHGIRAGSRARYRYSTRLAHPVASRVQKRIEPSSAAHSEITE
jgi:hypothetical protein